MSGAVGDACDAVFVALRIEGDEANVFMTLARDGDDVAKNESCRIVVAVGLFAGSGSNNRRLCATVKNAVKYRQILGGADYIKLLAVGVNGTLTKSD